MSAQMHPQNDSSSSAISYSFANELKCWAALFEVDRTTPYPVTADKLVQDFKVISTLAAIIHAADWLTVQFLKYCILFLSIKIKIKFLEKNIYLV